MTTPQRPRRRGLLDPDDLHGSHVRSQGAVEDLNHVREWVLSILLVSTFLHFAAGFALVPVVRDDISTVGRLVLLLIAACIGALAIAGGRLIHQRSVITPWLVAGLVPAAVGAWFTFA